PVTGAAPMTPDAFQQLINSNTSGKNKKLHVWSARERTVTAGESLDLDVIPTADGKEFESLHVGTSEFGEGGRRFALDISALKRRVESEHARHSILQNWSVNTRAVVPLGSVTIFGGHDGDPHMGRKGEKKLPPQLLYIAVTVAPAAN
ncbi:MAG: hypothetical protein LC800_09740, partial [Acidobacteria bacterium]|nr:hypothetical protein [Acidobacteriota bacterium]